MEYSVQFVEYQPKTIINRAKHVDGWFWTRYSAYPYLGCQHGCEFCYCRERKFSPYDNPEDFNRVIKVKTNAPALLDTALLRLTPDTVFTGDYQPAERKYELSRRMLSVCLKHKFPVFVLSRSPLVLRDLDVLSDINRKARAVVGFSIISTAESAHHSIVRQMERLAPPANERFRAMEQIARQGILTGTCFMPILPGICDSQDNIDSVVRLTKEHGGSFVLAGGLTLADQQRGHFMNALARICPEFIGLYQREYGPGSYGQSRQKANVTARRVREACIRLGIEDRMPRPVTVRDPLRINKLVVESLCRKVYDMEIDDAPESKVWPYRKAAWAIADLDSDLGSAYAMMGISAIQGIPDVNDEIANIVVRTIGGIS